MKYDTLTVEKTNQLNYIFKSKITECNYNEIKRFLYSLLEKLFDGSSNIVNGKQLRTYRTFKTSYCLDKTDCRVTIQERK